MKFWLNGALTDADAARIDPRDRGFTLGDGLFETMRVKDGAILRLDRHLTRLADGLRVLNLDLGAEPESLTDALASVLKANALREALLRLTVTRGPAARGVLPDPAGKPTILITAAPYAQPKPVRAIIATVTRRNEYSPLSRIKSTNYLDSVLARIEADGCGADEAILLNTAGNVAEATIANLFAVIDGKLATPRVKDGALPGIMRAEVVAALGAEERSIAPAELMQAEEVFLTASSGIRPVIALRGRAFPPGPMAARAAAL